MQFLDIREAGFQAKFDAIVERGEESGREVEEVVLGIIADVRSRGDEALLEYTRRFDMLSCDAAGLEVTPEEFDKAMAQVEPKDLAALKLAVERVARFHEKQKQQSWISTEESDIMVGQKVTPLAKVGIYVPGGKACYPSSVVMNAVPAKVAGVGEIVMVVPAPGGEMNPHVLAAAKLSGVDRVFRIGGAQAVAALAYGTATVPKVDKITGPGNIYVATAKKLVFGQVGIDMIAGPSEILVINDGSGNPVHVAADLLSQAEHDELASSVLITADRSFGEKVANEVERQLKELSREAIARKSWESFGVIIVAGDLDEAIAFSNRIAPEHLELAVENPFEILPLITNAGAIFMGHYTPEAAGDYLAGPNHTLPTGGTARFFSPLSVDDFVKKSSIIHFTRGGLERVGEDIVRISRLEGLDAHGRSVSLRLKK
ncbi:histidinol dehydrogenase [Citrifermentans bemidjiense Bem]|uniref:Histidinol dehydrogenase n=1 Tax=Citrifermentans bemidjiense (strain ATCC BAA-1014 / DSM 16622 / JCM 12645 / Bem) TaxID=404380 RepID=B5EDR8_CITBB|nr:histidinol dehydrogenase [Citrifermentans bemidjiense]ACH40696.1 histidinol dehydrogenase [Citrifermentans bemidjiense Bem]